MSSFYSNSSHDIFAEIALDVDRLADAQRRKESYENVIEYLVKQDLASSFVEDLNRLSLSEIGLSSNPLFILDGSPFSEEPLELMHLDDADMEADSPAFRVNDSPTVTQVLYQRKLEASCLSAGPFYALRPVITSDWDVTSEVPTEATTAMKPETCPSSPHNSDILPAPHPTRPHLRPNATCLLVEPPQSPEYSVSSAKTEQEQEPEEEATWDGLQSAERRCKEEQSPEASTWCSRVQDSKECLGAISDLADSENEGAPNDDELQFIDCDLNKGGERSDHPPENSKNRKPSEEKVGCPYTECKYSTKRPHDLKRHIRSIHTGEKKYVCQWPGCQAGFVRSEPYRTHYLSHAGGKQPRSVRKRIGQCKTKRTYRRKRNISYKL